MCAILEQNTELQSIKLDTNLTTCNNQKIMCCLAKCYMCFYYFVSYTRMMSSITKREEWKKYECWKKVTYIMRIHTRNTIPKYWTATKFILNTVKTTRSVMKRCNGDYKTKTTQNVIVFRCVSCEGNVLKQTLVLLSSLIEIL